MAHKMSDKDGKEDDFVTNFGKWKKRNAEMNILCTCIKAPVFLMPLSNKPPPPPLRTSEMKWRIAVLEDYGMPYSSSPEKRFMPV